jgi:aspartyl-tRNA(Asn)/glutamyl-tRNA(Gln) amidotransferase subunit A
LGFARALEKLTELGAEVVEVSLPSLRHASFAETVTLYVEASTVHHHHLKTSPESFGDDIRPLLQFGEMITGVQYIKAQQIRRIILNEL